MRKFLIVHFLIYTFVTLAISQGIHRTESEYKLAIPEGQLEQIWNYLQESYIQHVLQYDTVKIIGKSSVEDFVDVYFETPSQALYSNEGGVRFRSRYKDGVLLKELIQLKLPLSQDGLARSEIKYELDNKLSSKDIFSRHPFIKYIRETDRDNLRFHLRKLNINPESLDVELTLKQKRSRAYLEDKRGSIATITLDEVSNMTFPFQSYAEMEIELNEIRYTEAGISEKERMDEFGSFLKDDLRKAFPDLVLDQTPKYNKMKKLIDNSPVSWIIKYYMWVVLAIILLFAVLKFYRLWK